MFPMIALVPGGVEDVLEVAIKVESIADFSSAHDLGMEIYGYPMGPYRVARLPGSPTSFAAVERRGYLGFDPFSGDMARIGRMVPHAARDAIAAREVWQTRRRSFDDDAQGFDAAEKALERTIELAGSVDLACHLIFEVERDYWTARNRAAQVQKARQDRLGLGWANHDHHTFRSSRRFFPRLIALFERLGFALRERYHAGEHAGWGAQILEHPTTGVVIFADLDLAPEEADRDFAHDALPDLPRPNSVGLWVGLHGESILGAGHATWRGQFDFDRLARRPGGRGRHRHDEAVLELPVPPPGLHRRPALGRPGRPRRPAPLAGLDRRRAAAKKLFYLAEGAIRQPPGEPPADRGLQGLQQAGRQHDHRGDRPSAALIGGRPRRCPRP